MKKRRNPARGAPRTAIGTPATYLGIRLPNALYKTLYKAAYRIPQTPARLVLLSIATYLDRPEAERDAILWDILFEHPEVIQNKKSPKPALSMTLRTPVSYANALREEVLRLVEYDCPYVIRQAGLIRAMVFHYLETV